MEIRNVSADDASQIAGIYNHYIAASTATFEIEPIGAGEMIRRIKVETDGGYPFIVCVKDGELVGYAYGHEYRPRPAYRHSVEVSVYIKAGHEGTGIGTMLYERLIAEIKKGDFHAVIAGISLPNDASVQLHEKFGMEKVAHFGQVGRKFGLWIDVGYWELILDRPV